MKIPLCSQDYLLSYLHRSILMKSKVEPLTMSLMQIRDGLQCYNLLNIIKEHSDLFFHIFCPSKIFKWDFQSVAEKLRPVYSEDGSNRKNAEVTVYKLFIDFVESCFFDGETFSNK